MENVINGELGGGNNEHGDKNNEKRKENGIIEKEDREYKTKNKNKVPR